MTDQVYLSIIIPVHNEQDRLPVCIQRLNECTWLRKWVIDYEIIIVDNGSVDRTLSIAAALTAMYPRVRFESLGVRGKGLAIRHGMLVARGLYRYMCDVDLSTPPYQMSDFLQHSGVYDVVIGSRVLQPGMVKMSPRRRMIGKAFHALAGIYAPGIHDTQCGFKLFRAHAAQEIFERLQTQGMAFDVEVLWLARRLGYAVKEIPVEWCEDADSRVNVIPDSVQMLYDVLMLPFRQAALPAHAELRRS